MASAGRAARYTDRPTDGEAPAPGGGHRRPGGDGGPGPLPMVTLSAAAICKAARAELGCCSIMR